MPARSRTRKSPAAQETPKDPRAHTIQDVVNDVRKHHGDKVIHKASIKPRWKHVPTGVFSLDLALFGGVPEGLATLIYGWESSGKTTLAMRCLAQAQRKYPDMTAVMVDLEGTYDPTWGAVHGVDNEKLLLVEPDGGEQALDILLAVIEARDVSMAAIDSLAALIPIKEQEASIEDDILGVQARMMAKFSRKVMNSLSVQRKRDHWPAVVLLNQWRMKIAVNRGDPRVLPGGVAQHYLASVKVDVKNREHLPKTVTELGDNPSSIDYNDHAFKIDKNKVGTGLRTGEFKMIRDPSHPLGQGHIDDAKTVITWGRKKGVVTGSGGSFRLSDVDQKFSTLDAMCEYVRENEDYYERMRHTLITEQRRDCGLIADGWY